MRNIKLEPNAKKALKKADTYFQSMIKEYGQRLTFWAFRKLTTEVSLREKIMKKKAELEKQLAELK